MKTFAALLLALPLLAAQTLTLSGPASAKAGATITVPLTLSGAAAAAALQWQLVLPSGSTATAAIGAAGTAATKSMACSSDSSFCLEYGQNVNVISAGVVATYTVHLPATASPGTATIGLSNLLGASAAGAAVPITAGAAYSFTIADRRDLNGDGVVNTADVTVMQNEVIAAQANPAACVDDQNGDGACNLLDLLAVLLKALGLVP